MEVKKSISKKTSKHIRKKKDVFYLTPYTDFEPDTHTIQIIDDIFQWGYDDDVDDFFENVIKNLVSPDFYYMNYRIANFFFRLFIKGSDNFDDIDRPSFINELTDKIKSEYTDLDNETKITIFKSILILIKNSLINLIKHYNIYLISIKDFFEKTKIINETIPEQIILYRGFNIRFNEEIIIDIIKQIRDNPNNIIVNSVLSSSISEKVVFRFLGTGERGIIWKIIVPQSKYKDFKYSFVKKNYPIRQNTITIVDYNNLLSDSYEYEFLLNYGLMLKYIETKQETRRINSIDMSLDIYIFEFLGYDFSSFANFQSKISKLISEIDNV